MPSAVQPRKGRSAQESTLSTPQLLGHILSFLAPLWPKYLVNAALVCKQWTKQAIDLRWSRCNIKFSRLLRKLDPKMEVDKGDYSAKFSFEKTEDIGVPIWKEFLETYASRVTRLKIDCVLRPEAVTIFKDVLAGIKKGAFLCPSLVYLELCPSGYRDEEDSDEEGDPTPDIWAENLSFLATPVLPSVQIAQGRSTDRQLNLHIHVLAHIAPNITSVEIVTPDFTPDFAAFKNMRTLTVNGWFDHEGWKSLARCEHLEAITLCEAGDDRRHEPGDEEYEMALPKLKHFSISDPDELRTADFIHAMLRNTTMPMLETVKLSCTSGIDKTEIRGYVKKGRTLAQKVSFKFGYESAESDED